MKITKWPFWCLLAIAGCQSATDQLREAEHRFLQMVSVPEPMQLAVGGDTLFLPLLPVPNAEMDAKKEAGNLQIWIQKIDPQALETPDRQRLEILERAVNDLVLNGVSIPSDQVCTQIADPFQQILKYNNPELTQRFLEKLPVYVTEMEQRCQAANNGSAPRGRRHRCRTPSPP